MPARKKRPNADEPELFGPPDGGPLAASGPEAAGPPGEEVGGGEAPAHVHLAPYDPNAPGVAGQFRNWFLDYSSYVILERAVPHIDDGLKPVQRRILHVMWEMEDGRYNKVANIIGNTMKYHPHGDSAIGEAIIGLGQKELLIDTQGNWGNILTGDNPAAARYIEARLTKFALEVAFNPKTTSWSASYDGRNREPVTLPMKFPLLLAQGAEGIAVGLACKLLPHNFIELCDACIAALRNELFVLLPDFPTGGLMDASEYNEGLRGGRVRVRARIESDAKKKYLLRITEIPFGTTAGGLQESIVAANEKGKIKIQKVEDLTAAEVEILVHLTPGTDPEQIEQALYAFTDCEMSIAPNACVIMDDKPHFLSVHDILRHCAAQTRQLLKRELEIRLGELDEKWHFSSLEKIFIENRIYRDIEECTSWEAVMAAIWKGLKPYLKKLRREVTDDDVARLTEIRIKRISKYNSFEADEQIRALEEEMAEVRKNLAQLTKYAVRWFTELKKKFGAGRDRRTEITSFSRVDTKQAAVATENLMVDREGGFVGYGLKRGSEIVDRCSRLDEFIVFRKDGTFSVFKVADKTFVGPDPLHVALFRRGEESSIYHMIYRDGRQGRVFAKRFTVEGVTREKVYDLTRGTKDSRVLLFSLHESKEKADAAVAVVHLKPALRLRKLEIDVKWAELDIKNRGAIGITVTDNVVARVAGK
ncbi:MAG: DNA gyrase/topoisomerase IV subunit A [Verrucomicrobiales bacterium]